MLISFKVKNFYSIKEEQSLNFLVNENAPKNSGYAFDLLGDKRASKFSLLIGANASGKTSMLKAVSFIKWFIARPQGQELFVDQPLPYKTFFNSVEPSTFEAVFELDMQKYTYTLSLDNLKVLFEELRVTRMGNDKTGTSVMFCRNYNNATKKYDITNLSKDITIPNNHDILQKNNIGLISMGVLFNDSLCVSINNYWNYSSTNVPIANSPIFGVAETPFQIDLILLHQNQTLKNKIENILKNLDLGFERFHIEANEISKNQHSYTSFQEVHNFKGTEYRNDVADASNGTRRLVSIISRIITSFEKGSFVIIDEIDTFLHPRILSAIVDMFFDEEINTKNSQLIFSSHSHMIMNRLDKYQIILAEKNEDGATVLYSLDSFGKDIRNDDDFYQKYTAGAYGATPNI